MYDVLSLENLIKTEDEGLFLRKFLTFEGIYKGKRKFFKILFMCSHFQARRLSNTEHIYVEKGYTNL